MSIRYICYECSEDLKLSGFKAVNEAGRKFCDCCGDNGDLFVVSKKEFDIAVRRLE